MNRIKEVLELKRKTPIWLAKKIRLSKSVILSYCRNQAQPGLKDFLKIADLLEVDAHRLDIKYKNSKTRLIYSRGWDVKNVTFADTDYVSVLSKKKVFLRKKRTSAITLLFLSLFCLHLGAQEKVSPKTYTTHVTTDNSNIKAEVLYDKPQIKAEKDLSYFWYGSNKIVETKGGYDGRLLHGEYKSFYLDQNLKEKGNFNKGLKDGAWISWYSNGKIQESGFWKKGYRSGKYEVYNESGQKVVEATFKRGKLNGKMISYADNKVLSTKKYKRGDEVKSKHVKTKDKEGTVSPRVKPTKEKESLKERWYNLTHKKGGEPKPKEKKEEKAKKKDKNDIANAPNK